MNSQSWLIFSMNKPSLSKFASSFNRVDISRKDCFFSPFFTTAFDSCLPLSSSWVSLCVAFYCAATATQSCQCDLGRRLGDFCVKIACHLSKCGGLSNLLLALLLIPQAATAFFQRVAINLGCQTNKLSPERIRINLCDRSVGSRS